MPIQIPENGYLRVKVTPKSSSTKIGEILADGTIKIKIKAPPEKNKANIELIKFLSNELKVPQENISIIAGKSERLKLVKINATTKS